MLQCLNHSFDNWLMRFHGLEELCSFYIFLNCMLTADKDADAVALPWWEWYRFIYVTPKTITIKIAMANYRGKRGENENKKSLTQHIIIKLVPTYSPIKLTLAKLS